MLQYILLQHLFYFIAQEATALSTLFLARSVYLVTIEGGNAVCMFYIRCIVAGKVPQWHSGKVLDMRSIGRGFNSYHYKAA